MVIVPVISMLVCITKYLYMYWANLQISITSTIYIYIYYIQCLSVFCGGSQRWPLIIIPKLSIKSTNHSFKSASVYRILTYIYLKINHSWIGKYTNFPSHGLGLNPSESPGSDSGDARLSKTRLSEKWANWPWNQMVVSIGWWTQSLHRKWLEITISIHFLMVVWGSRQKLSIFCERKKHHS